jgi:hypothetical protein
VHLDLEPAQQIIAADAWERGENSYCFRIFSAWHVVYYHRGAPLNSAVRLLLAPSSALTISPSTIII